jgi:demethylmenaquinone methyltransferase/2-methoxy-6-polyprenyl-1,4-benzoquinol methylase
VDSIRAFPDQKKFAGMIEKAGFSRVQYRNLSGGIAAIHSGLKL